LLFPVALLESLGMDAGDDISSNRVSAWIQECKCINLKP
jgi:hypothetical protein